MWKYANVKMCKLIIFTFSHFRICTFFWLPCSMQVTEQLIDKLAHLARLRFDATEKSIISADLEKMIQFVEKLNELDLDGVEPLMHMSESSNVLRDDKVQGSISREAALRNAPDNDGTYFRVPKVIRK